MKNLKDIFGNVINQIYNKLINAKIYFCMSSLYSFEYFTDNIQNFNKDLESKIEKLKESETMQLTDLESFLYKKWEGYTKIAILINDKTFDKHKTSDEYESLDNDKILNSSKSTINLLFQELAVKNISLVCLNLNNEVNKMYTNFKNEYNKGKTEDSQCEFIITNYDNLSNAVTELATKIYTNLKRYNESIS